MDSVVGFWMQDVY